MGIFGFVTHLIRNSTIYLISDLIGLDGRVRRRIQQDIDNGITITKDFSKDNFIIFSDIHRGNRDSADRFKNELIYYKALSYYNENDYNLVLLGDIEECWGYKNRMGSLKQENMILFQMEMNFVKKGKYFRIIGNHDDMWEDPDLVDKYLNITQNDSHQNPNRITPYLSVTLEHEGEKVLLIHGCQGHNFSDIGDKFASGVVNFKFSHGIQSKKDEFVKKRRKLRRQEKKILKWAKNKEMIVIMGHTHVPYFMSVPSTRFEKNSIGLIDKALGKTKDRRYMRELNKSKKYQKMIIKSIEKQKENIKKIKDEISPVFFNSGNCCKDSDEISAIEISGGMIKEVYWRKDVDIPEVENEKSLSEVFNLL